MSQVFRTPGIDKWLLALFLLEVENQYSILNSGDI